MVEMDIYYDELSNIEKNNWSAAFGRKKTAFLIPNVEDFNIELFGNGVNCRDVVSPCVIRNH